MRFLLTLATVLTLQATCAIASEAAYVNMFDKRRSVLEVGLNNIVLGDLGFAVTQCANMDKFACITSKVMMFAVPRNDARIKTWTLAGASYKVLSNQEAVVFGELIKYRLIQQKWRKLTIEYAYSDERGVIGIKTNNGHQLMLTAKCGFAAISDAYGCQSKGPGTH